MVRPQLRRLPARQVAERSHGPIELGLGGGELGTLYGIDEVKELTAVARRHGLKVHMDGTRIANAIAADPQLQPVVAVISPTLQFGGIAAILLLLSLTRGGRDALPWWALLAWYGAAKIAEAGDVFVWNATREVFAGHGLKHLAAAAGGLAIANALRRPAAAAPGHGRDRAAQGSE